MLPLLRSCLKMWVYCEDPREEGFEEPGCRGFPTAMTRRKVKGELLVGVTQSGQSPVARTPMKRGSEDCEAKGRGLNTKQYQAQ